MTGGVNRNIEQEMPTHTRVPRATQIPGDEAEEAKMWDAPGDEEDADGDSGNEPDPPESVINNSKNRPFFAWIKNGDEAT
eukprot:10484725-Lingulodinium_polyedra.AAC.1